MPRRFEKMKKFIIFLGLLVCTFYICSAQTVSPNSNSRIEQIKVAFFTKQLQLNPVESKAFWPIYNKYFGEIKSIWHQSNGDREMFDEKAAAIKDKYRPAFVDILHSHERANEVFKAERAYRSMLRAELKERKNAH